MGIFDVMTRWVLELYLNHFYIGTNHSETLNATILIQENLLENAVCKLSSLFGQVPMC